MPDEGGYAIVWWDPSALPLGASPPLGLRRGDLVVRDVPRHVVADGRGRYDRWKLARHDARAQGATPSLVVTTVKELTSRPDVPADLPDVPVTVIDLTVPGEEGSGGAAFGTLVHAVLAQAPFDASRDVLRSIAEVEARLLGLAAGDAHVAARKIERVLGHDVLHRAREASARGACRRETPVTMTLGGALVEGVVDLAFEEGGRWVVVDYKTDRELLGAEEAYRRQVAIYASAIAAATSMPVAAFLIRA